jgi:hypothetical protein
MKVINKNLGTKSERSLKYKNHSKRQSKALRTWW